MEAGSYLVSHRDTSIYVMDSVTVNATGNVASGLDQIPFPALSVAFGCFRSLLSLFNLASSGMCLARRFILNPYTGHNIYVPCGKCPACKQEKAIRRSNIIRANFDAGKDEYYFFVTLTYSNNTLPYIAVNELKNNVVFDDVDRVFRCTCNIYRDVQVDYSNYRKTRKGRVYNRKYDYTRKVLDTIDFVFPSKFHATPSSGAVYEPDFSSLRGLRRVRNQSRDIISVKHYKDFQDYAKRFKTNVFRAIRRQLSASLADETRRSISYYVCEEYGPTTSRYHLHALFFVPKTKSIRFWQYHLSRAWPYDSGIASRAKVQIARNPSSYLASYVNSDASVASFLQDQLPPRHHYSFRFGVGFHDYKLDSLWKMYLRRDFSHDIASVRDGALVVNRILVPQYVLNRYAPKFKGFHRVSSQEIYGIASTPRLLHYYAPRLEMTPDDVHKYVTLLEHKQELWRSSGYSVTQFALFMSQVYTIRASQVLRHWYTQVEDPADWWQSYDNISHFVTSPDSCPTLHSIYNDYLPDIEYDANMYPSNVVRHEYYTELYHSLSKDKKIRNEILSERINV